MVRTLFFTSIGLLILIPAPTDSHCVWAGRVYSDAELKLNGRVCQICQAGKWVDKDIKCDECRAKTNPVLSNPPPTNRDCTAQLNSSSPQRLTFTDGARVEQEAGVLQMCSAGQWVERPPAPSQICQTK
jgi:hypothetical protein